MRPFDYLMTEGFDMSKPTENTNQTAFPKGTGVVRHVQMTVETALGLSDEELFDWFSGQPASETREILVEMEQEGRTFIHTEGCDNEDPITGKCLGHESE